MKTIAALLLLAAITVTSSLAEDFDALDAAPTPAASGSPTPSSDSQRFKMRMADAIRLTYNRLSQAYEVNHRTLTADDANLSPAAKLVALTPAQLTEVVTIQWEIYSILKSINPKADLPLPPSASDKPKATPKK